MTISLKYQAGTWTHNSDLLNAMVQVDGDGRFFVAIEQKYVANFESLKEAREYLTSILIKNAENRIEKLRSSAEQGVA